MRRFAHHADIGVLVYEGPDDGHFLSEVGAPYVAYSALHHALPITVAGTIGFVHLLSLKRSAMRKAHLAAMTAQAGTCGPDPAKSVSVLMMVIDTVRCEYVEVGFGIAKGELSPYGRRHQTRGAQRLMVML